MPSDGEYAAVRRMMQWESYRRVYRTDWLHDERRKSRTALRCMALHRGFDSLINRATYVTQPCPFPTELLANLRKSGERIRVRDRNVGRVDDW